MKTAKLFVAAMALAVTVGGLVSVGPKVAEAAFYYGRSYYSSWSYYPSSSYYYSSYYYKPYSSYTGYKYHYCVYYPSTPSYVYYYNPYTSQYWGRYDLEKKGYSLLAEKDRKKNLKEIPETAFPAPGKMPAIPESEDGVAMAEPEKDSLPKGDAPKDVPPGR